MSRFPWQMPYMHAYSNGSDDQIEALQTDVMRFTAILGLCLMAIFSIVQSLPYQAAKKTPELESKELLQSEIQKLQNNLSDMLDKIKQLDSVIQQKQLSKQQLDQLEETIETQRGELSALNQTLQQEQQALSQVRKKLKKEKINHIQRETALQKIEMIKTPTKKKPQKTGFSLRFASDTALLGLLKQHQVNLYLLMGKHAWKIAHQTGNWQVQQTKPPKQYYQMSEQTVPSILRQTARNNLSVQSKSQVVWAVELPVTISTSITRLMKNQQGGDLVIGAGGGVKVY